MTQLPDYRQHLEVETPEHVILDYEVAGLGSRAFATLLDTLILTACTLALIFLWARFGHALNLGGTWAQALFYGLMFVSLWGYFTFFEGFRNGQTPGKRRAGIRVVSETGHAITFGAAAARNLLRVADFLPSFYLLGGLFVAIHPRARRLGDLVAGTVVVRDRPAEVTPLAPVSSTDETDAGLGVPELDDEEFRLLREYSERAPALPADVRQRVAGGLAQRFIPRFPEFSGLPEPFLADVFRLEQARRRSRFAARGARGAGATRPSASGVAERLVARKSARWDEFDRMARRATEQGLDSFAADELPDFAARYREIAADLARARTYRAQPPVLVRLGRLVAAGHNALYRDERKTGRRIWTYLLREAPSGIVEAWKTVLLAFVIFLAPGLGGYALLRERPALAQEVIPQGMLERAEAGKEREASGQGYVELESDDRPMMASRIMTNNIQVAFFCFAGGVFAGVGALVLLAYNGLEFGAISGHFANSGLLGYLYTFVIGHGVVELFAIWVAGAAGFLLGKALIMPGDLSRTDALALAGRLAMRMVTAVILLLVVAGLIEGFVSAGSGPLEYRLAISGASVLLLVAYLANGWVYLRRQEVTGHKSQVLTT
ncbi:MAG TPA: stage II sporulation protein M [Gemmatimonadales bacterium]|nr:stage II sporulation protein M [Gemmatimonadales bacterium]